MKTLNRKIASQVRAARKKSELSLRQLAALVDATAGHLCNVESGDSPPGERLLKALCTTLELDFDELWCSMGNLPADVVEFLSTTPAALARVRRDMRATKGRARTRACPGRPPEAGPEPA